MKRIIYTSIFISTVAFLGSCKKDYTCSCTEYYEGADTSWNEPYDEITINGKKSDVDAKCQNSAAEPQTIDTETYWIECELSK